MVAKKLRFSFQTSALVVENELARYAEPSRPSKIPVQSPVASSVSEPPELVRPVPRSEVKRELLKKSEPTPNMPVVVAFPTIVVEPTARRPPLNVRVVVVASLGNG